MFTQEIVKTVFCQESIGQHTKLENSLQTYQVFKISADITYILCIVHRNICLYMISIRNLNFHSEDNLFHEVKGKSVKRKVTYHD